ncbi:hypothetical protein MMC31_005144 [Peltigera leucophlebia]|nr:hypothetical protein [Peltigera leucophlebia]
MKLEDGKSALDPLARRSVHESAGIVAEWLVLDRSLHPAGLKRTDTGKSPPLEYAITSNISQTFKTSGFMPGLVFVQLCAQLESGDTLALSEAPVNEIWFSHRGPGGITQM